MRLIVFLFLLVVPFSNLRLHLKVRDGNYLRQLHGLPWHSAANFVATQSVYSPLIFIFLSSPVPVFFFLSFILHFSSS